MARQFSQAYTLLGFVTDLYIDKQSFKLRVRNGDSFLCRLNDQVWYRPLPNLFGSYDRYGGIDDGSISSKMQKYLAVGVHVLIEGVLHRSDAIGERVDVRTLFLLHSQNGKEISITKGPYMFEEHSWWVDMITAQGNTWFNSFFSDGNVNFTKYRTDLNEIYQPTTSRQEVAVMSRLLYGFAVTYQLTGKTKYLNALRNGVEYQRNMFRFTMPDGKSVLWASYYDGTNVHLPSDHGDDAGAIALYEQIYALAGMTMYYRITQDTETLKDIMATIDAFDLYFKDDFPDKKMGGYFSHIDPDTFSPFSASLGINQAKKNWNSVGDHIPAYLINLICALAGKPEYSNELDRLNKMLLNLTNQILEYFPPKEDTNVKLVFERFNRKWEPDLTYTWQQNRGIIGHNLKIAWNLTRVGFYLDCKGADKFFSDGEKQKKLKKECFAKAKELAIIMDELGGVDRFRGGCYDAVEREPTKNDQLVFTWFSTKDFWQQEQGILTYLIQMGASSEYDEFQNMRELAASMSAFYCAFFVDVDRGGIYFRTSDIGTAIMTGEYANKGGHAKSGYHIFELCYLAHIYTALYNSPLQITLHFQPVVPPEGILNLSVFPDFLADNSIKFKKSSVEVTGKGLPKPIVISGIDDFNVQIPLPESMKGTSVQVQVTLVANNNVPSH